MDALELRYDIFKAIKLCSYNKRDPNGPPGAWSCWIHEHGVFGEQMQTQFCLNCGEYLWLTYQIHSNHPYHPSPNEPRTCQCTEISSELWLWQLKMNIK